MSTYSPLRQLVIDAGVCFTLMTPVETQARISGLINAQIQAGAQLYAPTLMRYELASTFTKAVALGGMSEERGRDGLRQALALPIHLVAPDESLTQAAFDWTLRLQRAAAYDSFYLALAEQMGCELWTVDRRLAHAVNRPWVCFVG